MEDLVSMAEINADLGLGSETIRKSATPYKFLFEGITPQSILVTVGTSRIYKYFVTKDEAALIIKRYIRRKHTKTKSASKEAVASQKLAKKLNGVLEYKTDFGRCDIVTDEYCIEVKTFKSWKGALGQALCYATAENKKPAIALFDHKSVDSMFKNRVTKTCRRFGVAVFWI